MNLSSTSLTHWKEKAIWITLSQMRHYPLVVNPPCYFYFLFSYWSGIWSRAKVHLAVHWNKENVPFAISNSRTKSRVTRSFKATVVPVIGTTHRPTCHQLHRVCAFVPCIWEYCGVKKQQLFSSWYITQSASHEKPYQPLLHPLAFPSATSFSYLFVFVCWSFCHH